MSGFSADPDWLSYHPSPRKPSYTVPTGAVDAHCHVFGPHERFPFAPERKYTPADAGKDALWKLRDYLGFSKNVIVQASCHGTDNRALVDALNDSDDLARGVAVVRPDISHAELSELHRAGVRGVRFNFVKRLVDALPFGDLICVADKIAPLGWHTVIYFEAPDLPELYGFLMSLQTPIVIDHMGRPDLSGKTSDPGFQLLHQLMREHHCAWCKVSCPERLSVAGPPDYLDFVPFARSLVEAFPERVLWGTDWPHPNMRTHMPDDGDLVDMIPRIAPTRTLQHRLLVDNPEELYWSGS